MLPTEQGGSRPADVNTTWREDYGLCELPLRPPIVQQTTVIHLPPQIRLRHAGWQGMITVLALDLINHSKVYGVNVTCVLQNISSLTSCARQGCNQVECRLALSVEARHAHDNRSPQSPIGNLVPVRKHICSQSLGAIPQAQHLHAHSTMRPP
jgi:hypothetical protein